MTTDDLIGWAINAPWQLSLLAGAAVLLVRCRHRLAAGLGAAGLVLAAVGTAVPTIYFPLWAAGRLGDPAGLEWVTWAVGLAFPCGCVAMVVLLVAAAFAGRPPVTGRPAPGPPSSATGPRPSGRTPPPGPGS